MSSTTDLANAMLQPDPAPKGRTLAEALGELIGRIEKGEPIIQCLPTGVALFDSTTGGLVRGEYAGIIAHPGAGKSTIADLIVLGVLRNHPDATALICNLETSTAVRAARLVAGQSVRTNAQNCITLCAPIGAMLRGQLRDSGRDHARTVAEALSAEIGGRLRFVDDVHDAEAIGELIRETRPTVVLIDHLGLTTFDAMPNGSAVDRFDSALHAIADAVRSVNAAGILISEVNKLALAAKSADLSAVRGSARFASLAGMMVGIVRDDEHEGDDPRLLLQLAKNRHGRAGVQQGAILYGGMSYVYFEPTVGAPAPEAKKRRKAKDDAA